MSLLLETLKINSLPGARFLLPAVSFTKHIKLVRRLCSVLCWANLILVHIGTNKSKFYTSLKRTRFVPDNQSSGLKQPERGANHLPPFSDEFENALSLSLLSQFAVEQTMKAHRGSRVVAP
jgi:hypothetical protein